ncbi:MAG: hypothetical protein VR69_11775 [Peptococcaceae bacterium BRH_c4b]|nr:MAG: hypothetical protein VR69_11775 [Peptococcaceae bacterium BRH_c4b]
MKIGAGGLQCLVTQDIIASRQAEQAKQKPSMEEEILRGQQKLGPELNKPVIDLDKSAVLSSYLSNKEAGINERKRKAGDKKEDMNAASKGPLKHGTGKDNTSTKGSLLDEYK